MGLFVPQPSAQIAMDLGQERIIAKTAETWLRPDLKTLTVSKSFFPSNLTQSQLAQSAIGQ